ncbi:Type III secretion inner membrane channel protein (LcrD,HrcV,EscV,SsaV) [Pseudomonas synxantha]|uniref:Type III secretion inner membrane channel protein (LcrD,HrcV,EscV,SsaV) n=1 Tax=Pseudomonas synxantha TaxID=47883 RepID=A0A3G7UBZ9_9PSED|nr:type III secretion system export apparatus subunit SctV [Pseudomonas synxantha]AZE56870.1 Type III secretion inner membrane channel protein (LcrD,HrcV,EscV,SsaV) [Pseudomonas synxantha]
MHPWLTPLHRWALLASKRSELVTGSLALAIVFMMILPLPTWLVDVLITLNISFATLLVALAMLLPSPLAFSSFPAVLLLSTLFRLALSVATTRLILLEQDAGQIVEAFGNFVVGGNLAVGLVMFLILTLVNFMVITKGSERVAEVAARFSLDAMPGKQMSIDSDLRSGLITAQDAILRRETLARESQLFGAMDGAIKFVKGDAIAGIVIVAINMLGGFSIGMLQHDMSAGDAARLYSVLTIGDGLIAQIPALLISLTAGMMITRVAPEALNEGSDIGRQIAQQMMSEPKAWIGSSIGSLGFALVPGMPSVTFIIISALTGALGGYKLLREHQQNTQTVIAIDPKDEGSKDLRLFTPTKPYLIRLPGAQENSPEAHEVIHAIRQTRNRLVVSYGLTLPSLEVEYDAELAENTFVFLVNEIITVTATFGPLFAVPKSTIDDPPENAYSGKEERQETQWLWLPVDHPALEALEAHSALSLLVQRLEHVMLESGPQFLGLQETKQIVAWLEANKPEVAQELLRTMPLSRVAAVLQRLVSERISIRGIIQIAEVLIEHGQHERSASALTEYARIALKAHIYEQFKGTQGLNAWLLAPETEALLRDLRRQSQTEIFFALEVEQSQALVHKLREAFPIDAPLNAVLLVAQDLRSPLRELLRDEFNHIAILSFAELLGSAQIQVVGSLDLGENF